MIETLEPTMERPDLLENRSARINVTGRSSSFGDHRQRNAFGVEASRAIVEMRDWALCDALLAFHVAHVRGVDEGPGAGSDNSADAGMGGSGGPLTPQENAVNDRKKITKVIAARIIRTSTSKPR